MTDIHIKNVDIKLLDKQRKQLIKKIWNEPNSIIWGIVNMLDDVCDEHLKEIRSKKK